MLELLRITPPPFAFIGSTDVLLRNLFERLPADRPAGIVEQHVELAESLDCEVHRRLDIPLLSHVRVLERYVLAETTGDVCTFFVRPAGDDDLGPFGREELGRGFADTARSPGDERDLVRQTLTHVPSRRFWRRQR
jgi:hypothetical protein